MANLIDLLPINFDSDTWAQDINTNFDRINTHNHSLENGTGDQINIEDISCVTELDFTFTRTFVTDSFSAVTYFAFTNISESIRQRNTLYVKDNELYYTNSIGIPIQISSNGTLNVTTVGGGGFTGTPSFFGASVTYNSGLDTYTFLGNTGSNTTLNCGNVFAQLQDITTLTTANTFNIKAIAVSNISPVAVDGTFLLFEPSVYSPTLTTVNINQFATTSVLAKSSIAQVNTVQAIVETSYTTGLFAYKVGIFSFKTGIKQVNLYAKYFTIGGYGGPNKKTAYVRIDPNISPSDGKSSSFIYSLYNRNGKNSPPSYDFLGVSQLYSINSTYPTSVMMYLTLSNTDISK